MRAYVYRDRIELSALSQQAWSDPEPGPHEVVLRMRALSAFAAAISSALSNLPDWVDGPPIPDKLRRRLGGPNHGLMASWFVCPKRLPFARHRTSSRPRRRLYRSPRLPPGTVSSSWVRSAPARLWLLWEQEASRWPLCSSPGWQVRG
jgi:hypothetical protein